MTCEANHDPQQRRCHDARPIQDAPRARCEHQPGHDHERDPDIGRVRERTRGCHRCNLLEEHHLVSGLLASIPSASEIAAARTVSVNPIITRINTPIKPSNTRTVSRLV